MLDGGREVDRGCLGPWVSGITARSRYWDPDPHPICYSVGLELEQEAFH